MKNLTIFAMTAFSALVITSAAFAWDTDSVTLRVGDGYHSIPACGPRARVEAVYSRAEGNRLALRFCDVQFCKYPVMLNTNRNFQASGDGKTEMYYSANEGRRLNTECYEFLVHNPTGTQNYRARFGSDSLFQNAANITVLDVRW